MSTTTFTQNIENADKLSAPDRHEDINKDVAEFSDQNLSSGDPPEDEKQSPTFSYRSLSSMLRVLGAGVLATSMSIFLFQGWADGDDIYRFAVLIGFSGMLAVAGLTSSHVIRENIGARLFLGIALLSVVVNFAIAGGLVYSGFQTGQAMDMYPEFARWEVGTSISAVLVVLAAIVVLAPVSLLGFRALARRSSGALIKVFLLANAALLVPIRGNEPITLIVGVLTIFIINQLTKAGRSDPSLNTMEGRFAQAIVLAPMFVMIGRMVFIHSATAFVFTSLSALIFVAFRQIGLELDQQARTRQVLDYASTIAALGTAFGSTVVVSDIWPNADVLTLPVLCLVFAGMLVELSVRTVNNGALLRRVASMVVAAGISTNLMLFPSAMSALVSMSTGLIVVIYGYTVEQKLIFAAGLTTLLLGFAYQLWLATTFVEIGNWGMLAIIGTVAILLASVLERHGLQLRQRVGLWRTHIDAWDA